MDHSGRPRDSDSGAEISGMAPHVSGAPAPPDNTARRLLGPPPSLPKGGGAIRGLGEKFAANVATGAGTSRFRCPPARRSGFGPTLALGYDSARGKRSVRPRMAARRAAGVETDRSRDPDLRRPRHVRRLRGRGPSARARRARHHDGARLVDHAVPPAGGEPAGARRAMGARRGHALAGLVGRQRAQHLRRRPLGLGRRSRRPDPRPQLVAEPLPRPPWQRRRVHLPTRRRDRSRPDRAQRGQQGRPRRPAAHRQPLPQGDPLRQPHADAR